MARTVTLIAICILLATTPIKGYAEPPEPSVSSGMQKGGNWVLFWNAYGYPSYLGSCASLGTWGSDPILFTAQLRDGNGDVVDQVWQWVSAQQYYPGPFYSPIHGQESSYCIATATFYWPTAPANATIHSWIDLAFDNPPFFIWNDGTWH